MNDFEIMKDLFDRAQIQYDAYTCPEYGNHTLTLDSGGGTLIEFFFGMEDDRLMCFGTDWNAY